MRKIGKMKRFALDKILKEKLSPSEFAKYFFNRILDPYQAEAADCKDLRIVIAFGRQSGKTELTAIKGLHHALTRPGATVLILSRTLKQAGHVFDRMKISLNEAAMNHPELDISNLIMRETQLTIEFNNGSKIFSLTPGDDGTNIRGFVATMIIVDEAAYVNDAVFKTITPMLATTAGYLILLGTPHGVHNYFAEAFLRPELGYTIFHRKSEDCPRIPKDFLTTERSRMSDLDYLQEYEAAFLEEADTFFPVDLVDRCIDASCPERGYPLPTYDYYLGCDPAREGKDETAFCILERRNEAIYCVSIKSFKKKNIAEIANMIAELHRTWMFRLIIIDETGVGAGLVDILKANSYPVTGLRFTQKSKEEAFSHLKSIMMQDKITLPPHEKLRKQLLSMKYEARDTFIKIFTQSENLFHDDYVAALVLACWGIKSNPQILFAKTSRSLFS